MSRKAAVNAFRSRYGRAPALVVRSPGRVNLIGDHTDYNDGFVLPMAIDQAIWIAAEPRVDGRLEIHSLLQDAMVDVSLDELVRSGDWADYVTGVAIELRRADIEVMGWNGVIATEIPTGAGVSSSAALEMATARVFTELADAPWDGVAMAQLGQRAENDWVGANVGIMDQLISACGEPDAALLIDCRSLDRTAVAIPPEAAVVVIDSGTRRGLVDSQYNERRATCEAVASICGVAALRDVDMNMLDEFKPQLADVQYRRARHVVRENAATAETAKLLPRGELEAVGDLMNRSHESLRDDFEISTPMMDLLTQIARSSGAFGARMTGGGFGGSAVALVETARTDDFIRDVLERYADESGNTPGAFVATPASGTSARWL